MRKVRQMPFEPFLPRRFNLGSIKMFVPAVSGVFGISNSQEWLYIGESANIRESLLSLLSEGLSEFQNRPATGFAVEVCEAGRRPMLQDCLVREYEPVRNRRSGR